jgi:hypothetical protein
MFDLYGRHRTDPRDRAVRIFAKFVSLIVLALLIYVVLLLANIVPSEQGRIFRERQQRSREILDGLDISLLEAGFIRTPTSDLRDIYMPQLVFRVANLARETFVEMSLECRFIRGKQFICGGRAYLNDLKPDEARTVTLKCVESVFTGSVVYGIGLEEARRGLEYEVVLVAGRHRIIARRDSLAFELLN